MKAVLRGHIDAGSVLLVENLDRISRQAAWRAQNKLGAIVEAGITVVTLNDERVYNAELLDKDNTALFVAVMGFIRAHDESAQKSRRLKSTWAQKRKRALTSGEVITSRCPGWLEFDRDMRTFRILEERAAVVRRIFAETLKGMGRQSIARILNEDGAKPFGSGEFWRGTTIGAIQANPAVIGNFVPESSERVGGKRVRQKLEPIRGYFPCILEEEIFQRVQALRLNAGAAQRGRHVGTQLVNVFAGLLRCANCGGTAIVVAKGVNKTRGQKTPQRYIVCERAKSGKGCTYRSARLSDIESAFREDLPYLLTEMPAGDSAGSLDQDIAGGELMSSVYQDEVWRLIDLAKTTASLQVRTKLRELEAEWDAQKQQLDDLYARREATTGPFMRRRLEDLKEAAASEVFDHVRVNVLLRELFRDVVVDKPRGQLRLTWAHGGERVIQFGWPEEN